MTDGRRAFPIFVAISATDPTFVSANPAGAAATMTEHKRKKSRRDTPAASRWDWIVFSGLTELAIADSLMNFVWAETWRAAWIQLITPREESFLQRYGIFL